MSSKEKSKFEELARHDKIRYDQEMQSYVPPKGSKASKKKKKDPNAPKRPPWVMAMKKKETGMFSHVLIVIMSSSPSSAFFVFCSDHRPKIKEDNPGISIGEIAKKLGELWSTQSPKDKAPYEARAAKLKEKYEKVRRYWFTTWYWTCK